MFSGVLATGFFICLASAIWSGGTRGLSGSRSSAPTTVAEKSISAALTPKNLEKYRITLPPFVEPIARDQRLIREAADRDTVTRRNTHNGGDEHRVDYPSQGGPGDSDLPVNGYGRVCKFY